MTVGKSWPEKILDPSNNRLNKPRLRGITIMIDKGLGLSTFQDLLECASSYIDYIKLGFGTSVLYSIPVLVKKIELASQYGVKIFPGGTLMEAAIAFDQVAPYLDFVKSIGFQAIEISDGTIDLSPKTRKELIEHAQSLGLIVFTEYGKKLKNIELDEDDLVRTVESDLDSGASYVIVEGRESGVGAGIYDHEGNFDEEELVQMTNRITYPDRLIWEAPLKKQQERFIHLFGPNVNLGNIAAQDIFALEALRRGLRSDTLYYLLQKESRDEG